MARQYAKNNNPIVRPPGVPAKHMLYSGRISMKMVHFAHDKDTKDDFIEIEVRDTYAQDRMLSLRLPVAALGRLIMGVPLQKCVLTWHQKVWDLYESEISQDEIKEFCDDYQELKQWVVTNDKPGENVTNELPRDLGAVLYSGPGVLGWDPDTKAMRLDESGCASSVQSGAVFEPPCTPDPIPQSTNLLDQQPPTG